MRNIDNMIKLLGCCFLSLLLGQCIAATGYPFQDYRLSLEERVSDLVGRLTLEEKIGLLDETTSSIPRLGIEEYHFGNEALHGVVRPGKFTVFPQAIAFGACWDTDLMYQISTAISDEARARHNELNGQVGLYSSLLTFFSPTINMARDPRWGRTAETYGEDPFLTSQIGIQFIKGLQGTDQKYLKVAATPKHFVANNEEHNRSRCNAVIPIRFLHEYYLTAFRECITKAHAQAIMSAYNGINGVPCSANRWLLKDLLRDTWGFDGYVVTDCGAVSWLCSNHKYTSSMEEAAAAAINAGVDLNCGDGFKNHLLAAYKENRVKVGDIDRAVSNVLRVLFKLGIFDPSVRVPYSAIPASVIGCEEHQQLARRCSQESIVLLKNGIVNHKKLLPINEKRVKSIAVLGPNADVCVFGDYSGKPQNPAVTPLEGIQRRCAGNIDVKTIPWKQDGFKFVSGQSIQTCDCDAVQNGLVGEYFDNPSLKGEPVGTRIDPYIYLDRKVLPPDPLVPSTPYSVRWTGELIPNSSGKQTFSVTSDDGVRLYVDEKCVIDKWITRSVERDVCELDLVAGQPYDLRLEYFDTGGESTVKFEYAIGNHIEEGLKEDLELAASSDLVIACMGTTINDEREGLDRDTLDLSAYQLKYLDVLRQANPNVVVVLISGGPISSPWMDKNIPAILTAWYPGEQGGNAIADILFGDCTPSGRLPLTIYASLDELPPFDDYDISRGRTYMYLEDKPLYEFGYGLSYTTFDYSNLLLNQSKYDQHDVIKLSLDIQNTGDYNADEVVQAYIKKVKSSHVMPIKQLKGFKRVHIERGQSAHIEMSIPVSELYYFDEVENGFAVERGKYEVQIGSSSKNIRLSKYFVVE